MKHRVTFLLLATAFAATGCSNSAGTSTPPRTQVATDSASRAIPAVAALIGRLPAGTRVYVTDSFAVHAGNEVAVFSSASRVTRTAAKLIVVDAASGETFTFPSTATIDQSAGGARAYVQPQDAVPAWVSKSNGRLSGVQ